MSKLPSQKTTIRDMSQYTNIGDGISGINVATIINAKTGPMERMTLTSFDDLVNYYCTGSAITQRDDITVQCVGAMLNTSAVDVIRVGESKLKVGKTNDGKIVYTDSNYKLFDKLSRISFIDNSDVEDSLAISTDDISLFVGTKPKQDLEIPYYNDNITREATTNNLIKLIADRVDCNVLTFDADTLYHEKPTSFYDTYLTNVNATFINASTKISANNNDKKYIELNSALILNNTSYIFNGTGRNSNSQIFEDPKQVINWLDDDSMTNAKFLALVTSYLNNNEYVSYSVKYDFSNIKDYSDNLKEKITDDKVYYYNRQDSYDSLFFIKGDTLYRYNDCELPEKYTINSSDVDDDDKDDSVVTVEGSDEVYNLISINGPETDFSRILNLIECDRDVNEELILVLESSIYMYDSNIYYSGDSELFTIDNKIDGIYKCHIEPAEYQIEDNYSVFINGHTYYCGEEPIGVYVDKKGADETAEYITLSKDKLTYGEFIEKLYHQLQADMMLSFVNSSTILIADDVTVKKSSNIKVVKSIINQTDAISNSKFALIAKFPTSQQLFSYSYIRNEDIEDFDIIDVNWSYNQISGVMSIGFDDNSVDNFGTSLYYTKYNEGETENDYFHILQLNDFVKWDKDDKDGISETYVNAFGSELIVREPTAIDYADAIKKFLDYEDKQYSFIWDSGYASPVLAKAMNEVALEKNAQFVPSYPLDYRTVDEFIAYHNSLGLNTFQGYEIVPAHKGSYCGSFLTKVPAGLSYITARINSYRNGSVEYQPLFGPTRGVVSAPNLICSLNTTSRQKLSDLRINSIVSDINGTYICNNDTALVKTSYLSDENIVYMTNTIAHICEEYNPKIIAEESGPNLWDNIINQLTQLIEERLRSGKKPSIYNFRVVCDSKLNTQDIIESHRVKYKVECQFTLAAKYVTAYTDVVRLNSF